MSIDPLKEATNIVAEYSKKVDQQKESKTHITDLIDNYLGNTPTQLEDNWFAKPKDAKREVFICGCKSEIEFYYQGELNLNDAVMCLSYIGWHHSALGGWYCPKCSNLLNYGGFSSPFGLW